MTALTKNQLKELEKDMKLQKERIVKEIFSTIYDWGRYGVKVDYKAQAYQRLISELKFFL